MDFLWIQCIHSALSSAYYTLWLKLAWPLGQRLHRHLSSVSSTSPHRSIHLHSGLRCRYSCLLNGHVLTSFRHMPKLSIVITSNRISTPAYVKLSTSSTRWSSLSLGLHCLSNFIGYRYCRSEICWCSFLLDRYVCTSSCPMP